MRKGGDPAVESMMRRAYDMGAKSWGAPCIYGRRLWLLLGKDTGRREFRLYYTEG